MKDSETTTINEETVPEQGVPVAPEKNSSRKGAIQKNRPPKRQNKAKGGKVKAGAPKKGIKLGKKAAERGNAKPTTPRAESKRAKILEMIGRAKGATLTEIMKATGWQSHSVRGFISTAGKKEKVNIESSKNEAGDRLYKIAE